MSRAIKVLIVDDSAVVRKILQEHLQNVRDIEIVGAVGDPYLARETIAKKDVDVITLDLEMPKMDGLTFLKHLMKSFPLPVIIVSSLVKNQADLIFSALSIGAVEVIPKPGGPFSVTEVTNSLVTAIRNAVHLKSNLQLKKLSRPAAKHIPHSKYTLHGFKTSSPILAIGTSTGGTRALEQVLSALPPNTPPMVIVIHMPPGFTKSFAERMNELCRNTVTEARDGETAKTGHVYISPGDKHLTVVKKGVSYVLRVKIGPKVNRHCPSVDVLFNSLADSAGPNCIAAILTGMGDDGARGLLRLRKSGAHTIAQDEASSIVFGMPMEAIKLGGAEKVVSLDTIVASFVAQLAKMN